MINERQHHEHRRRRKPATCHVSANTLAHCVAQLLAIDGSVSRCACNSRYRSQHCLILLLKRRFDVNDWHASAVQAAMCATIDSAGLGCSGSSRHVLPQLQVYTIDPAA